MLQGKKAAQLFFFAHPENFCHLPWTNWPIVPLGGVGLVASEATTLAKAAMIDWISFAYVSASTRIQTSGV